MRNDVREVIEELYKGTLRHQEKNGVRVDLSLTEYLAKWSPYRIKRIASLLDKGGKALSRYLRDPAFHPLCGWTSVEARASGVMHNGNCSIQVAKDQRHMFQFKAGDKHSPDSIERMKKPKAAAHKEAMRKPKSNAHRAEMSLAAKARWAAARAAQGGAA